MFVTALALASTTTAPTIVNHEAEITEKPISSLSEKPTTAELKDYLGKMINKYGGNFALIDEVIQCESGWQINPKPNGISWGIAQFTPPTWVDFGEGDIMNPYKQIEVMVIMFNKGLANRWDCFRQLN